MEAADDIRAFYARRRSELESSRAAVTARVERIGALRLGAFLVAVGAAALSIRLDGSAHHVATAAAWITFLGFISAVWRSRIVRREVRRIDDLLTINVRATARMARDWNALPGRPWDAADPAHPYSSDLDILGDASLMQLFPTVSRAPGDRMLSSWLLHPAEVGVALDRQAAVRELAPLVEFREELERLGMRAGVSSASLDRLSAWATGDVSVPRSPWLPVAGAAISVATIAAIGAQASGVTSGPVWLLPVAVGLMVSRRYASSARAMFVDVRGHAPLLRTFDEMIALIEAQTFTAPLLRALRDTLVRGTPTARHAIGSLARLSDSADVRHSPMLHAIVNVLLLWDLQITALLARWQSAHGQQVMGWLDALGAIESLAALASLAHDNPTWAFPELTGASSDCVDARALGHPLIAAGARVGNDVVVGPAGTVLLISGSNMSGKSTLMRAIGVNVVLAQAGSVVCAGEMRCPRLDVSTSMRVQDSLRQGVSRFMAELLRIKTVVEAADATVAGAPRVLYLLDELLQGTNSAERAIAAQRVVERLTASGAIGVVTTHDLALLAAPQLEPRVRHAHFREQLSAATNGGAPAMSFDYVLRPGRATSHNALALLALLGVTE